MHSIRVLKAYHILTNCSGFVVAHPLICSIGGHEYHDIVFLFHNNDTKRYIVKLTRKCIHGPHILVGEGSLDLLTIDIARPVPPLIDDSGSIRSLLFYIHQSLQNTETGIQHNNLPFTMNIFEEAQH